VSLDEALMYELARGRQESHPGDWVALFTWDHGEAIRSGLTVGLLGDWNTCVVKGKRN